MASLYDRPDLYDLTDKESKDKITLGHWETLFKGKNIQTVLDVSIGTGGLTLPMTDMGIALSGTDLSEKMLSRCKEKADKKGVRVDLRVSDFRRVSEVFDRKFDCVVSTGNSLPYVNNADIRNTLHQMDVLVKENGYLYFDTRNWDKILKEKQRFFLYNPVFKEDERVNLIQVWDYHEDASMTFNILYTFEKEGKIYRREEFTERYFPVKLDFLLGILRELNYTDIEIMPLPVQFGPFDREKTNWYCVMAKKGA